MRHDASYILQWCHFACSYVQRFEHCVEKRFIKMSLLLLLLVVVVVVLVLLLLKNTKILLIDKATANVDHRYPIGMCCHQVDCTSNTLLGCLTPPPCHKLPELMESYKKPFKPSLSIVYRAHDCTQNQHYHGLSQSNGVYMAYYP